MITAVAGCLVAMVAQGCGGLRDDSASGKLTVEWHGSERGKARLPATLDWCPVTRMATLRAISNDTGVLITLKESDSITVGAHQVVSPDIQQQSPVPNATAALRWVEDTSAILGYASVSGVVDIGNRSPTASGSIDIRMRKPASMDTVILKGDFRGVPVTTSAVGCVSK